MPLAVAGRVTRVEELNAGRVAVATIEPTATPKGEAPAGPLRVVEMRDLPSVPAALTEGTFVLALVEPLRTNSYLAEVLPPGEYRQLAAGRVGRLVAADQTELDEIVRVAERIVAASREPEPDPTARAAAARALVFDEIAARNAALVQDGAAGLATLAVLEDSLTAEERGRIEAALARTDLPAPVRAALVRAVGAAGLTALVPALRALPSPEPAVLEAAFQALAKLGAPPTAADLAQYAASDDPAVRAAAAKALAAAPGEEGIRRAGELARSDPDASVRRAAVEALGEARRPEALPVLEGVFREAPSGLQQVAGRGIFQVGGPAAAETLARLAFEAPPGGQRLAVVLLMALQGGRDDALVQRIGKTHPDADLRRLVEHGIEPPDRHDGGVH